MMPKHTITVATLACLAMLLSCLFPPRQTAQSKDPRPRVFLFAKNVNRANETYNPTTRTGSYTHAEVSSSRLLAELGAIIAASGLAFCLLVWLPNPFVRATTLAKDAWREARSQSSGG